MPQGLDYDSLASLRRSHPAWRLLASDNAPFVIAFLHRAFVAPNVRTVPEMALVSALEDFVFQLREHLGPDAFPRRAGDYLDEWCGDGRGWLRKYYPAGSDEPHIDITVATEKALEWLASLRQRQFVGTESRLRMVFELLREMVEGVEVDPEARLAELEKRRALLDAEIDRVRSGQIELMDATQLKDRFQQMAATARGLLSDFREVDQNFRDLDRVVRERVAGWDGAKGALLAKVFGERDAIADSDQGKSFRAFWDFLMSPARQEELSSRLETVFALPEVQEMSPDRRLLRVHYDWLEAGEVAQRTVARLSSQLRRYLDDRAWLENKRIMQILQGIEQTALRVRGAAPTGAFMPLDEASAEIALPMDRPLFAPRLKGTISAQRLQVGSDGDGEHLDVLFEQVYVDKGRLTGQIRRALEDKPQVTLAELLGEFPLEQGLAELVTYFDLAAADGQAAVIDDLATERVSWIDAEGRRREADAPLVIFCRTRRRS